MKNCLLLIKQKPVRLSICASLLTVACVGMLNADDTVPNEWNVAPMTNGAYLASFEGTLPAWANATGASEVTDVFPTMTGSSLPTRSNAWFAANSKVMALDTEGTIISNELQNSSASPGAVSFATDPVYVDMRVRFNPMEEAPDPALLANCKLAIYVNSDYKLVAAHNGGSSTNSTVLNTNMWHQITVRMTNGICNVYRNDVLVFDTKTLNVSGTVNALDALSFKGAGYVDELYVSHGAPDYAVVGPTTGIPTLPTGGDVPTDEQQTRINTYLSNQPNLDSLGTITQDELSAAYLVNATLTGDPAVAPAVSFGISEIDIITETSLKITVKLSVAGSLKSGDINGRIQLQGKVNKIDSWITLDGAVSPGSVSFTSGEVTFTYNIPAGNYRFFKRQIIPKEI